MRCLKVLPLVVFAAAVFMVVSPATAVELHYFEMTIDPPSGSNNQVDLTVDIAYNTGWPLYWVSGSDTAEDVAVSGNMWTRLGMDFDPVTQVASVQNIEFDGGSFVFDTISMSFIGGLATATGTGIGGTFDTPAPPAPMMNSTQFDTSHHSVELNQGTFVYDTPIQSGSFDLAANPVTGSTSATGSIIVGAPSIIGSTATYAVTLTLPLAYDEDLDTGDPDMTAHVTASGNFVSHGSFSRAIAVKPVAVDDPRAGYEADYTVAEDNTLNIGVAQGVLVNDTDPNGDTLSAIRPTGTVGPSHGSLTLNSNGSLVYTPDANWHGTDTFTYKASDGANVSDNPATVSVVVDSVLDVPNITLDHIDNGSVGGGLHAYTLTATGIGITSLGEFTIEGAVNQVFNGGQQTEWLGDGSADDSVLTDSYVIFGDQRIPEQGDITTVVTEETITLGGDSGLGTLNNSTTEPADHDIYMKTGTPSPYEQTVELMYLVLPEGGSVDIDLTLLASLYHGLTGPGESDVSSQSFSYFLAAALEGGDTDGDGDIDGTDLANFSTGWYGPDGADAINPTPNAEWATGDFDTDGDVDGTDLATFSTGWYGPNGPTSASAVPEPGAIVMLILGVFCLIGYRNRK